MLAPRRTRICLPTWRKPRKSLLCRTLPSQSHGACSGSQSPRCERVERATKQTTKMKFKQGKVWSVLKEDSKIFSFLFALICISSFFLISTLMAMVISTNRDVTSTESLLKTNKIASLKVSWNVRWVMFHLLNSRWCWTYLQWQCPFSHHHAVTQQVGEGEPGCFSSVTLVYSYTEKLVNFETSIVTRVNHSISV